MNQANSSEITLQSLCSVNCDCDIIMGACTDLPIDWMFSLNLTAVMVTVPYWWGGLNRWVWGMAEVILRNMAIGVYSAVDCPSILQGWHSYWAYLEDRLQMNQNWEAIVCCDGDFQLIHIYPTQHTKHLVFHPLPMYNIMMFGYLYGSGVSVISGADVMQPGNM